MKTKQIDTEKVKTYPTFLWEFCEDMEDIKKEFVKLNERSIR